MRIAFAEHQDRATGNIMPTYVWVGDIGATLDLYDWDKSSRGQARWGADGTPFGLDALTELGRAIMEALLDELKRSLGNRLREVIHGAEWGGLEGMFRIQIAQPNVKPEGSKQTYRELAIDAAKRAFMFVAAMDKFHPILGEVEYYDLDHTLS